MCCYSSNVHKLRVLVLTDWTCRKEVRELKGTVSVKALCPGR